MHSPSKRLTQDMLNFLANVRFTRGTGLLVCASLVALMGCSTDEVSSQPVDGVKAAQPEVSAQPEAAAAAASEPTAVAVSQPVGTESTTSDQAPEELVSESTSESKAVAQNATASEISVNLVAGRQYADARNQLLRAGWVPAEVPEPGPYGVERKAYEAGFTEVTACAGTGLGQCHFLFTHATENKLLSVITANGASLEVYDWEVSTPVDGVPNLPPNANSADYGTEVPEVAVIPAAFQGEWHTAPEHCGNPDIPGRFIVQLTRWDAWESYGIVQDVAVQGDREIVVSAEESGEGETFVVTKTFRLSADGSSMTTDDTGVAKYRCFG